ncbi:MAG: 3-keto-disaccharide hydrolase [Opitutales bacterium]
MKIHFHILLSLVSTCLIAGEVRLFNGTDINGWVKIGGKATFAVEDGAIVGTTTRRTPNTFLSPPGVYSDFLLEFEVKCDRGFNSGVQIRSVTEETDISERVTGKPLEKAKMHLKRAGIMGPQVEIADNGRAGGVFFEGAGFWIQKPTASEAIDAYEPDGWNHYKIMAQGTRIQTWINGVPVIDIEEESSGLKSGIIGLQVHSIGKKEAEYQVRWRNITIREL